VESGKIRNILKRYLEGNASQQEKASVDHWYRSFEGPDKSSQHHDNAKREVWSRIEVAIEETDRSTFKMPWLRAAAAILLLMATGTLAWKLLRNQKPETYSLFETQAGERRSVTLPDGSLLQLNSSTRIRVAGDFSKTRQVELTDGEVFFDVARDPHRPFIIHSGLLQTEVLGTCFNIRAYQDLGDIRVSVASGRVKVSKGDRVLNVLAKGQQLVFHKPDSTFRITTAPENAYAWKDGVILLEDVSFEEMALLIHKHYGVVVMASGIPVNNARYTATLRPEMKALEATEVLAAIHGFNVQLKRDTLMLSQ
jgi:transmembrane sensor